MPITRAGDGGSTIGSPRRRTRSIVSRDHGTANRAIIRAPGLPPRATATARSSASQRPIRRPYRRPKVGANGSLNVMRGQGSCTHRKRRTDSRSSTLAPLTGKSESLRSYRLWQDADVVPQSGQVACDAAIRPDIRTTPSTIAL
ncbi:hypothetical protein GCM10008023_37260 [Sphingomonas glacialis]|uniref:Uncharacterized protein n=1 Tax=Sphingomonas glacialis TaxID=658225 RepID=A0ABQ3LS85_9SPHN|nr:hypothetical protein GCM10008023_37260 [Sphingomonas glacialis]